MNEVMHRIEIRRGDIAAVCDRIESTLGVRTTFEEIPAELGGGWIIDFSALPNLELDFLRPDVLPPKEPA